MRNPRTQRPLRGKRARAFFIPRAFTLIELVIVLAIVGIVAAMAAPRFASAMTRQRSDGAAARIASDLVYARALARTTSSSVAVTFDPAHNRYAIPGPDPLRNTPAPYTVDLTDSPYRATLLGGAAVSAGASMPGLGSAGGTFAITFDGYGEVSAQGWILVRAGEWTRRVSIDSSARTTITKLSDSQARALIP